MKAADYMSRGVLTAKPGDGAKSAFRRMLDYRIRHLPVVDAKGVVVGMLSDRDARRPRWADTQFEEGTAYQLDDALLVQDIMTRNATSVNASDGIGQVAGLFAEQHFGAAPVLDDDGELVGLISSVDLHRALRDKFA